MTTRGQSLHLESGWIVEILKVDERKSISLNLIDPASPTQSENVGTFKSPTQAARFVQAFDPETDAAEIVKSFSAEK